LIFAIFPCPSIKAYIFNIKKSKLILMRTAKGISPLIATVLLIGATMSLAVILSFWASTFIQGGLPEINESIQRCQFSDFNIYQCSYNSSSDNLDITLQNLRQDALDEMVVQLVFPNGSVSDVYQLGSTLPGGVYQSYRLNDISDFTRIIVSSQTCKGIVPDKESGCTTIS